jgi:NADH dehydrogenase
MSHPEQLLPRKPHVVVVGGGFGGLEVVKALRHDDVRITLLDQRNHYLFQPLLYQVASAALNPADIAAPLREILRKQANVSVFLAKATAVDANAHKVILADGEVDYDYLVLATGATHSYFGHDEWAAFAPGLKTLEDAVEIRRRVLFAYEAAEREPDPERRRAWMTFVIVGGGPTGAELAGSFCEIARYAMSGNFRHINPSDARVILIEGAPHILPTYVDSLTDKARAQLEKLGTEVHTSARVTSIDADGVWVGQERYEAKTVVWAAGVRASPLVKSLGVPLDRAGRLLVQPDLSVPGHPEVMVIGDAASLEQNGKGVFGVAPAAMQGGQYAAARIRQLIHGQPMKPFHYVDKGSLATLGRKAGIADINGIRLSGFVAWAAWLVIHLFFLIQFRNRLIVITEWAWSYFTFQRGARLITGLPDPQVSLKRGDRTKLPVDGVAEAPRLIDSDRPEAH